MTSRREIAERLTAAAEPLYGVSEARQIARMILEARTGTTLTQLVMEPDAEVRFDDAESVAEQIAAGRPVQYVLGGAEFCGATFAVGEGVLIPRPETEELVMRVAATHPQSVLDIGTGSGCIAVSLARLLTQAEVWAVDLSEEALAYARRNASALDAAVRFVQADALAMPDLGRRFDAVVSNPPYIPQSERASMRRNVTDYEPSMALFVSDSDPLLFYRGIARQAATMLTGDGRLWFEVHERFAGEVAGLLAGENFEEVEIFNDINDKPRIVCGRRM